MAESGWDETTLQGTSFVKGLAEENLDELAARVETKSLEELIVFHFSRFSFSLAIKSVSQQQLTPHTPLFTEAQLNPYSWISPLSLRRSANTANRRGFASTVVSRATFSLADSMRAPSCQKSRLTRRKEVSGGMHS